MDLPATPGGDAPRLNEEWTAERLYRQMLLPYGVAGRTPAELRLCPHCARTYYRSDAGACPRCRAPVEREPDRPLVLPFGVG
jgi:uncharacterized paraquat-inducible protein A